MMKQSLLFLGILFAATAAHAYEARTLDNRTQFNKYDYFGTPVWDDAQRDQILARVATATAANFTAVAVSTDDAAVALELDADGKRPFDLKAEIVIRLRKAYNLMKMMELQSDIDALNQLVTRYPSVTVLVMRAVKQNNLDKYKARYDAATQ